MDNEEKKYFRDIKMALRKLSEIGVPVTPIIKAVMNAESELAEIEDERIRKAIRLILIATEDEQKDFYSTHGLTRKDCTDWLEKKKIPEGSPTPDLATMLVPNYYNGQKQAGLDIPSAGSGAMGTTPPTFKLDVKPAEWSDEDKAFLQRTISVIGWAGCCTAKYRIINAEGAAELQSWLEGFPNRLQLPKQEWSEEDEEMCLHIRLIVNMCNAESSTIGPMLKWLNDLHKRCKPQPHWKPSEEQMAALAAAKMGVDTDYELLESLYEQLKALK